MAEIEKNLYYTVALKNTVKNSKELKKTVFFVCFINLENIGSVFVMCVSAMS